MEKNAENAPATAGRGAVRRVSRLPSAPEGQASVGGSLPASEPALPTVDDLIEILAQDGWREVEYELITRHGMTLHDLARRLQEVDAELSDA